MYRKKGVFDLPERVYGVRSSPWVTWDRSIWFLWKTANFRENTFFRCIFSKFPIRKSQVCGKSCMFSVVLCSIKHTVSPTNLRFPDMKIWKTHRKKSCFPKIFSFSQNACPKLSPPPMGSPNSKNPGSNPKNSYFFITFCKYRGTRYLNGNLSRRST